MDYKVKFATLVAKLGVHFGAVDGNYDDKERAFVNLFIGFLKAQSGMDEEISDIIRSATSERYTIEQLAAEANQLLSGLSAEERKGTIDHMNNFLDTVIGVDGDKCLAEKMEFENWKKAIGA